MGYSIDIDTGGTFTDGFFVNQDQVEMVKVPTTPHDLTVCFLECIKVGAERFGISLEDLLYETDIIRFSSTIGTNAIIQRDGSKVGLLLTAGAKSLAPITSTGGKSPLVRPDMVVEIDENSNLCEGAIRTPESASIMEAVQALIDRGARCLVVAFSGSELDPVNERYVRAVVKQEYPRDFLGSLPVFLASDISQRAGECERINAAVLNAYIHAKLVRLLYKAGEELRQREYRRNLFIVHNNGAVAGVPKTRAINTYNSGPAAGLLGARLVGSLYEIDNLISADMGGTSYDLGFVCKGHASFALEPDVEGFPVNVPMQAIKALGAGGGSIVTIVDAKLLVGPQSAGALPGPVAFGLGGTEPTVTDANLVLGIIDPDYFLGGSMKLNLEAARKVIAEKIAAPLFLSVEAAALMIKSTIDRAVGEEIKELKNEIWSDGTMPTMVVYGGGGPAHCCEMAAHAGLEKVIITPFSSIFSAFSSSQMDVGHLYSRRVDLPFSTVDGLMALEQATAAMRQEAVRDMRGEGFNDTRISETLELFICNQDGKEVKLVAGADFYRRQDLVDSLLQEASCSLGSVEKLVLTTLTLFSQAEIPHYKFPKIAVADTGVAQAKKSDRMVCVAADRELVKVPVYDRNKLSNGHEIMGPAIIESEYTTVYVTSGWRLSIDHLNNAVLEGVLE
jgi:N-methylhydantoinase A/acetophenone carboxylase